MRQCNILLADDHKLITEGLSIAISLEKSFNIVGVAHNGFEALDLIKSKNPDIAIFDINMPHLSGLNAAKEALKLYPDLKILMLSIYDNSWYIMKAIEMGCKGYVLKSADTSEIIKALERISEGNTYYCNQTSQVIVDTLPHKIAEDKLKKAFNLTAREKEIIELIAEGLSSKEIANKLCLSIKTVDAHRSNIYDKMEVNNSIQLIRKAIKYDFIEIDHLNTNTES